MNEGNRSTTMTDRRPQRCPDHYHYRAGCESCKAYNTWYNRTRLELVAAGEWSPPVAATEARAHITALAVDGMTNRSISERSGISERTVGLIANGRQTVIHADTAAAILGVTLELRPRSQVPAVGSIRRVRALIWQGHTRSWICAETRAASRTVRLLSNGKLDRVTVITRDRLARLLRDHIDRPPADSRDSRASRREARSRGWYGPGAWTDIDDPDCDPDHGPADGGIVDHVAITEALAGRVKFTALSERERLVLFRDYVGDWSYNQVMRALNVSTTTVQKWRTRVMYGDGQVAA
jgi:transcriptional regulator with XRE-family HTH domain